VCILSGYQLPLVSSSCLLFPFCTCSAFYNVMMSTGVNFLHRDHLIQCADAYHQEREHGDPENDCYPFFASLAYTIIREALKGDVCPVTKRCNGIKVKKPYSRKDLKTLWNKVTSVDKDFEASMMGRTKHVSSVSFSFIRIQYS